jgi:hypothetical protein
MCTENSQLYACQYSNVQNYFGIYINGQKMKSNPPPQMQVRIIRDETVQSIFETEFLQIYLTREKELYKLCQ